MTHRKPITSVEKKVKRHKDNEVVFVVLELQAKEFNQNLDNWHNEWGAECGSAFGQKI